jgi:hypothetical protein
VHFETDNPLESAQQVSKFSGIFIIDPHGKNAGGTRLEARRKSKLFLTDSHLLKCIGLSKLSAKVARARAGNCWRHVSRNLWLLLNPQILGPRDHCRRFCLHCMHAALQKSDGGFEIWDYQFQDLFTRCLSIASTPPTTDSDRWGGSATPCTASYPGGMRRHVTGFERNICSSSRHRNPARYLSRPSIWNGPVVTDQGQRT